MCLSTHIAKIIKGFAAITSNFYKRVNSRLNYSKNSKRVLQKSGKTLNQCLVAGEQVPSKTDAVSISSNTSALEKSLSKDIQQRQVGGSSH